MPFLTGKIGCSSKLTTSSSSEIDDSGIGTVLLRVICWKS